MNDLFIHTLELLNKLYGHKLVYIEGKGFYVQDTYLEDGKKAYTSLDGTSTIFDLSLENKVYPLNNRKSIAELVRNVSGTYALHGRNIGATHSEHYRFVLANSSLSDAQQRIAQKYNIEDISEKYSDPFYKQILKELHILTIEAIEKAIRNKKSKRNILLIWEQIKELAENNDILGLEEQRDELLKLVGKQKRGENATLIREVKKELQEENEKFIRKIKIWSTVILFFTVLFSTLFVSIKINHSQNNVNQTSIKINQPQIKTNQGQIKKNQTITLTKQDIINAISKYNQNKPKANQITEWRKHKIIEYLEGRTMSMQALQDSIRKFANRRYYFWLKQQN